MIPFGLKVFKNVQLVETVDTSALKAPLWLRENMVGLSLPQVCRIRRRNHYRLQAQLHVCPISILVVVVETESDTHPQRSELADPMP